MNNYNKNSFGNDISSGQIDGSSYWFKFGTGPAGTALTTIWSGADTVQPGLYVYPDNAAVGVPIQMELVSSSASDAAQTVVIGGLDENWKLQQEVLTLDGITPVLTTLEYLRVFRMSVLTGADLVGELELRDVGDGYVYAHIGNGGAIPNQTQMAFYPVPAGYKLLTDTISISKLDINPVKIFATIRQIGLLGNTTPFRTQLNWNLLDPSINVAKSELPFPVTEKTDIEIRGLATTNKTGDIAINLFGTLVQVNSVPIDLASYSVSGGDTEVTVSWTEQTLAETSDLKYFEVKLYQGNRLLETSFLEDIDATGITFSGLDNGVEYTITAAWVGYDGKKSTVETGNATPAIVTTIPFTTATALDPIAGVTDGVYFQTEDSGATWATETISETGYDCSIVKVIDAFGYMLVADPDDVLPFKMYETGDDGNWSVVAAYVPNNDIVKVGDAIIRENVGGKEWSKDNVTWTGFTTAGNGVSDGTLVGSTYYMNDSQNAVASSDLTTWVAMTNQPTTVDKIISSATRLLNITPDSDITPTKLVYEYADGDVVWTAGGASTIAGTEIGEWGACYFNGKFHVVTYEGDFSASYYETSVDGTTWVDASSNIPASQIPVSITTDGTKLYIGLFDGGTFAGSVMASSDGTTFGTPVALSAGSKVPYNMNGRD